MHLIQFAYVAYITSTIAGNVNELTLHVQAVTLYVLCTLHTRAFLLYNYTKDAKSVSWGVCKVLSEW